MSDGLQATYRLDCTWEENLQRGPRISQELRATVEEALDVASRVDADPGLSDRSVELFGRRVSSPFGVAAGLLLDSRWVELYARLGFDLLTYKTVRSTARPSYALPNWVWVDAPEVLTPDGDEILRPIPSERVPAARRTGAVCFGMPSAPPEVWRADVDRARRALRRGQMLIVSVVGTPGESADEGELFDDFVRCARWAAEAGADAVEANFSCPNVCTNEGTVYLDVDASRRLAGALRDALPSTPFLIKCGHFADLERLCAFYRAVDGLADGVLLVNGVTRRVVDAAGRSVFGSFERVGIIGHAIRHAARRNLVEAVRWTRDQSSTLVTLAVGGVLESQTIAELLDLGAAAVLAGGGPMFLPGLALDWKRAP